MRTDTAVEDIRARLGELVADFWTPAEVLRALNAACTRFAMAEKWEWLYTVGSQTLTAGESDLVLTSGVSVNRHFLLSGLFSGDPSPRTPQRVTPAEGFMLQRTHYTDASDPVAYYLASVGDAGSDEIQSIENTGSTAGNFTITFDGIGPTANISRGASAGTIFDALVALTGIDSRDLRVYGGPLGTAVVYIEWRGSFSGINVPQLTLGGTTTNMSVSTSQAGGAATGQYAATLRFVPALTRDIDLTYIYLRNPRVVVQDSDILDIPEEYIDGVLAHATARLWLKELRDSAKADEQFGLYYAVVDDAKRDQRKLNADETVAWGRNQPLLGLRTEQDYSYGHFSGHLG